MDSVAFPMRALKFLFAVESTFIPSPGMAPLVPQHAPHPGVVTIAHIATNFCNVPSAPRYSANAAAPREVKQTCPVQRRIRFTMSGRHSVIVDVVRLGMLAASVKRTAVSVVITTLKGRGESDVMRQI